MGLPYNYDNPTGITLQKNTSFVTLVNDNINKIPRDLSEVGPQDKSFRSSVVLYGRVENMLTTVNSSDILNTNKQFYPGRTSFTTSSVETLFDIFQAQEFIGSGSTVIPVTDTTNAFSSFYKSDSNPFIAQITTSQNVNKQFGFKNTLIGNDYKNIAALAIFETKPVESRLDIFWETSTSGLLSGLNALVLDDSGIAAGLSVWNTSPFIESLVVNAEVLEVGGFTPVDSFGANIDPTTIQSLSMTVTNNNGLDVNSYFSLISQAAPGYYNIEVSQDFIDNVYFGAEENLRNFVFTFTLQLNPDPAQPLPSPSMFNKVAALSNVVPLIDAGQAGSSDNDYFVSATSFGTHTATNGVDTTNPNKYEELQWNLSPIAPVLQPYFTLENGSSQGNTPNVSIIRTPQTGLYLPGGSFSMDLEVTDAGGSGLEDSYSAVINTIAPLNSSEGIYTVWSPINPGQFDGDIYADATLFEVNFAKTPASTLGNGWYVYTDVFSALSNNNTLVDVRIKKTGASTVIDQSASWFFATTKQAVIDLYNESIPGTSNMGYFDNTYSAIPTIDDYTIVVK